MTACIDWGKEGEREGWIQQTGADGGFKITRTEEENIQWVVCELPLVRLHQWTNESSSSLSLTLLVSLLVLLWFILDLHTDMVSWSHAETAAHRSWCATGFHSDMWPRGIRLCEAVWCRGRAVIYDPCQSHAVVSLDKTRTPCSRTIIYVQLSKNQFPQGNQ